MRFILVMRHGLDMAFSTNAAQLHCWGSRYGVDPAGPEPLPVRLLRYWVAANEVAIERGERMLGDRFATVRFDDMCDQPEQQVPALVERLGIEPVVPVDHLVAIPTTSTSTGRYRHGDLTMFGRHDIAAVEKLGFPVQRR